MNLPFATLELEKELPKMSDLPAQIASFVQDAGILATIALLICGLAFLLEKRVATGKKLGVTLILLLVFGGIGLGFYALLLLLMLIQGLVPDTIQGDFAQVQWWKLTLLQSICLTIAGAFMLAAAALPMIMGLFRKISFRRIWAIARLSIKESIRNRTIYIFSVVGLVFLFYNFFTSFRPEDQIHQIRNYVDTIHTVFVILFVFIAALIGSFSIPVDVTRQTIHTIVTKPVVRYEIVLGRFLGHGLMLTVVLALLTAASFIYLVREINPQAKQQSYKARVPAWADNLRFHGTDNPDKGIQVGREHMYRGYIRGRFPGSEEARQFAIWSFSSLPSSLANRQNAVPLEFSFDIYRTTKGEEDKGVQCVLFFIDGRLSVEEMTANLKKSQDEFNAEDQKIESKWQAKYNAAPQARKEEIDKLKKQEAESIRTQLISKYGVYNAGAMEIGDYRTESLSVPVALFQHLQTVASEIGAEAHEGNPPAVLKVLVSINESRSDRHSRRQLVGVAARDLYFLTAELPFWQNYLKGMIGVWCVTMLVLAIAVACSTYFSAVISLFCTIFFIITGLLKEFIYNLVMGLSPGGGALEAITRLYMKKAPSAPIDDSTTGAVVKGGDFVWQAVMYFVDKYIPNLLRHDLTDWVAEGFDIPWQNVLLQDNILPMLAFLLPWGILAYYLMNSREIANPR